jgi:hypothetical protein
MTITIQQPFSDVSYALLLDSMKSLCPPDNPIFENIINKFVEKLPITNATSYDSISIDSIKFFEEGFIAIRYRTCNTPPTHIMLHHILIIDEFTDGADIIIIEDEYNDLSKLDRFVKDYL